MTGSLDVNAKDFVEANTNSEYRKSWDEVKTKKIK